MVNDKIENVKRVTDEVQHKYREIVYVKKRILMNLYICSKYGEGIIVRTYYNDIAKVVVFAMRRIDRLYGVYCG